MTEQPPKKHISYHFPAVYGGDRVTRPRRDDAERAIRLLHDGVREVQRLLEYKALSCVGFIELFRGNVLEEVRALLRVAGILREHLVYRHRAMPHVREEHIRAAIERLDSHVPPLEAANADFLAGYAHALADTDAIRAILFGASGPYGVTKREADRAINNLEAVAAQVEALLPHETSACDGYFVHFRRRFEVAAKRLEASGLQLRRIALRRGTGTLGERTADWFWVKLLGRKSQHEKE